MNEFQKKAFRDAMAKSNGSEEYDKKYINQRMEELEAFGKDEVQLPVKKAQEMGDVPALLATVTDPIFGVATGVMSTGEGIVDLLSYGYAGVADLLGYDDYADKVRSAAKRDVVGEVGELTRNKYGTKDNALLGDVGYNLGQGVGQLLFLNGIGKLGEIARLGSKGISALTIGTMFSSSFGSGMSEAYQGGATDGEAWGYGAMKGVVDAGTELIFGGLGKAFNALGFSKGLLSLDDIVAKKISSKISNQFFKNAAQYGVKASAEGVEELLAGIGAAAAKKLSYMSEENLGKLIKDEKLLEQFAYGAAISGLAQSGQLVSSTKQGRDFVSGLTSNEEAVVNKEFESRLSELENKGATLNSKAGNKLYETAVENLKKGYISTDTIESVLKTTSVSEKDAYLQESYNEKARSGQTFSADLSKYGEGQRETVQRAIDSGILNNTRRTHEFVDMLAKISEDTGISFDFADNAKLKELGFALEGITVNGVFSDGRITLNTESAKYLNTVVGHEVTHVLEGTKHYSDLRKAVIEYAKVKGEYDSRYKAISELYKNVDGADVSAELTADLVGDYLFTDYDFLTSLSSKNRNLFQRLYDEIKYLFKTATAGSREARELEKVKKAFERAYAAENKAQKNTADGGVKYSLSYTKDNRAVVVIENDIFNGNFDVLSDSERIKIVRNAIKKFRPGIPISGRLIAVTQKSAGHFTNSDYTDKLRNNDPRIYEDKFNLAKNIDDVVLASTDYINEELKHPRKDNIIQFARGNVLLDVAGHKYEAKVLVGYTTMQEMILYDVQDLTITSFEIKEKKVQPQLAGNESYTSKTVAPSSSIISQNSEKSTENAKNSLSAEDEGLSGGGAYRVSGKEISLKAPSVQELTYKKADDHTVSAPGSSERPILSSAEAVYHKSDDMSSSSEKKTADIGPVRKDISVENGAEKTQSRLSFTSEFENSVMERYGLNSLKGYVQVQKHVRQALPPSFYGSVTNAQTGMIVNITPKGINETFKYETYERMPRAIKLAKLATVDQIPEAIKSGTVEIDEQANYHSADSSVRYAYIVYDTEIEGQPCQLKIDVRKSSQSGSNRFHVHSIELKNKEADDHTVTAPGSGVRPILSSAETVYHKKDNMSSGSEKNSSDVRSEDNSPHVEDIPITTVEERLTAKKNNLQNELDNNVKLQNEALSSFDDKIAATRAEYDGKKNKDTKTAANLLRRIERYERLKADVAAEYSKRINDLNTRISGIEQELAKDHTKEDELERKFRRIDARVQTEKAELEEEYKQKRAELKKTLKSKNTYASNRASELYDEIRSLKKGVRASDSLGYILDHGFDWNNIKHSLLTVKNTPYRKVDNMPASESVIREMLKDEYKARFSEIDEEFKLRAEKIDDAARLEKEAVEKASGRILRGELHDRIIGDIKSEFEKAGMDLDEVFRNAKKISTFRTVDNTPQRVMEKSLGYKEGQLLADLTVNRVAQNESEAIKWLNSFTDRKSGLLAKLSDQYGIKPGSKESAAAQMFAEGFYVNKNKEVVKYGEAELTADFPDERVRNNIIKLVHDPRIRQIYDETLEAINKSRSRNAYPEIPRRDNYFLHFRAMDDTFSKLGLPFNPNDIKAKDLPTDLNGVTADLKPGQPYFASANQRKGKSTSYDLLGGLERYLSSAKNQIYHIDDIQTLRALRNYIADRYGQASGLEGLDELSAAEAKQKIKDVKSSHLSTFARFLNEEANIIAGKTAMFDRAFGEGTFGRRAMTFMDTINKQVGSNMVGFNISSSLTNFLSGVQAIAKSNKLSCIKALAQTTKNRVGSIWGKTDGFIENNPTAIRRKGASRFYRTPYQKAADAGYFLMSAVDDVTTEFIVRAKYDEFIKKGMSKEKAIAETDKWVSKLMGDRSLGQMPQLYNSKILGLVTQFQLEVRNQLDSQFYDTIKETQASNEEIKSGLKRNAKTAAKISAVFFELAILQHLFGKAFEAVAGYNPAFDIISVIITALGLDDEDDSEDTALDNIDQGFSEFLGDLPYSSVVNGGRLPVSSALPIKELINGEDRYGNEKPWWKTALEAAPYHILPGGYGQAKKTIKGIMNFDNSGAEDKFGNRLQAAVFGPYAVKNDSKTSGVEKSSQDNQTISDEERFAEKYPERYTVSKAAGGYDAYSAHYDAIGDIESDKDKNGKVIQGSKKKKIIKYINGIEDLEYGEKIILFKSLYTADDTYNRDIVEYLNEREDISYSEMKTILEELGFTVDDEGNISW